MVLLKHIYDRFLERKAGEVSVCTVFCLLRSLCEFFFLEIKTQKACLFKYIFTQPLKMALIWGRSQKAVIFLLSSFQGVKMGGHTWWICISVFVAYCIAKHIFFLDKVMASQ